MGSEMCIRDRCQDTRCFDMRTGKIAWQTPNAGDFVSGGILLGHTLTTFVGREAAECDIRSGWDTTKTMKFANCVSSADTMADGTIHVSTARNEVGRLI